MGQKGIRRTGPKKASQWREFFETKTGLVLVARWNNDLMNLTTTYFGGVRDLVQAWRYILLDAAETRDGVTHEEIEEILNAWVYHDAIDEPRPPEEVPPASSLASESA